MKALDKARLGCHHKLSMDYDNITASLLNENKNAGSKKLIDWVSGYLQEASVSCTVSTIVNGHTVQVFSTDYSFIIYRTLRI